MNVLFVYTNINGYHKDCYSFGLATLVSVLKKAGHNVRVAIVQSIKDYPGLFSTISEFKPGVIGFTAVSSQFTYIKELGAEVKKRFKKIIVVCGGVHPTISPECVLESEYLDGIFIGESENSFIEFLENIENKKDFKATDNFAYAENGKLIKNKLKPLIKDLDSLPYPDKEIYPYKKVLKENYYAPFLFLRGCPYTCNYCSNHALAKMYSMPVLSPRYRSPESSVSEIEETIRKFRWIFIIRIVDEVFGINQAWRDEFCAKYKKRVKIKFHCFSRPNLINDDLIKVLKESGCYSISMGIESGNAHIRNSVLGRQISDEQIIRAFDLAHKYGLKTSAINMIGMPGETEEMILDTVKINRKVKPNASGVNVFYPYRGTRLGDYCFEKNLIDKNVYARFSNERRESPLTFSAEYKDKIIYYKRNWKFLVYPDNPILRMERLIKGSFLWKVLRTLKRALRNKAAQL